MSFFMRFFPQANCRRVQLSIHTNQAFIRLVFAILSPCEVCTKNRPFLKIFLWSPLCSFAKNGHFRHSWINCYFSSNMSFFMRFFAQANCRRVQLSIHTNQAFIRLVFAILSPCEVCTKNRPFLKIFLWSPLCSFAKNRHFRHSWINCYFSSNMSFFMRFFAQANCRRVQLSIHTNQAFIRLVFAILSPCEVCTKNRPFLKIFLWSPLCSFAKNRHFRHSWINCYFSSNMSFFMRFFAQANCRRVQLSIHTNQAFIRLVFAILSPCEVCTKNRPFLKIFLWSPLCSFAKNRHFRHSWINCYFSSNMSFFMRFFAQANCRRVQLSIHTNQAFIRLVFAILSPCEVCTKNRPFLKIFLWSPLCSFAKNRHFRHSWINCYFSSNMSFFMRFFAQANCRRVQLSIHTNQAFIRLVFAILSPCEVCTKNRPFLKIFLWSPLCSFAKNRHFRHSWINCYFSSNMSFFMRFFAQANCRRVQLSIHTNQAFIRLVFAILSPCEVCTKNRPFLKIFLWSPLCSFAKNRHFRHSWINCYFSSNMSFFMRFFAQANCRRVQLSIHTNQAFIRLVFAILSPCEVCTKNRPFLKIFLWSPLCSFAKNRHFRHSWINCYFSSNMSFFMRFFAQANCRRVQLSIHTNQAFIRLVFAILSPCEVCTKNRPFLKIFLWSPLCSFAKNRHFRHSWINCYFSSNMSFFHAVFCIGQLQESPAFNSY